MNNTREIFKNKKAFIPFITAGDPSLDMTKDIIIALGESGADLIQIGIPFSDPIAEDAVIKEADFQALKAGVTSDKIFDAIKEARKVTDVPIAFLSYMNPIFVYGVEKFLKQCKENSICAIIVPDVPYEEREELLPYCEKYDIDLINYVAINEKERMQTMCKNSTGFIYCIPAFMPLPELINTVREVSDIPIILPMSVSVENPNKEVLALVDGIVEECMVVKLVKKYKGDCIEPIKQYIKEMKTIVK